MSDGKIISLLAHTIGSIGQIVKHANNDTDNQTKIDGFNEIKRIYDGYIQAIQKI